MKGGAVQARQREIRHPAYRAMIEHPTKCPIWCDQCGTNACIFIQSARRPHWAPRDCVEVTYFCTRCDSLYRHLVADNEIDAGIVHARTGATGFARK